MTVHHVVVADQKGSVTIDLTLRLSERAAEILAECLRDALREISELEDET